MKQCETNPAASCPSSPQMCADQRLKPALFSAHLRRRPAAGGRRLAAPGGRLFLAGLAVLALYLPVLQRLAAQWWNDANYSHGFLVPVFCAYVVWERRAHLRELAGRADPASVSGLIVLALSLGTLFLGLLGAELFLARSSLLGVIAGLVLFFYGWPMLRALLFPLGALWLMIPLPALIYNQIVFPLQLLASRVAAAGLQGFHLVPVLREGNVLVLPGTRLEVAEACSGIRSLMSMLTLGLVYGWLAERSRWRRALLCVAIVPIAVFSNAVRVMFAAVAAEYWGEAAVEGTAHAISGVVLFLAATLALAGFHVLLRKLSPGAKVPESPSPRVPSSPSPPVSLSPCSSVSLSSVLVVLLLLVAALAARAAGRHEAAFLRRPLENVPLAVAGWQGQDAPLPPEMVAAAGVDDYLNREYRQEGQKYLGLYVGFYRSQATGESIHSPKNCLPGSGWQPVRATEVLLRAPDGASRPVNLYIIRQGPDQQAVLYWYQSHGRMIASEYRAKLHMIADAIRLRRTDGALVRIVIPVTRSEGEAQADAVRFAEQILPSLEGTLPK
jgi:exosortase D (VPLPA-CTERM-specific)